MNYQNLFNRDFYPTPKSVIDIMMQGEDVTDKIILEPSAGSGNIVQWLVGHGAANVMACEINDTLRRSLRDCDVIGTDFLDVTSQQVAGIDYIVMNPPYLSGWKHLEHAYDIAPAGATIVCLLPWRDGYDFEKLEQWERRSTYDAHGSIRQTIALYGSATNIGDVFNNDDSERKHSYDIALVKIYKERNADEGEFDNYLWNMDETDTHCDGRTEGLMPYNEVYQLVSNYISAMRQYDVVYAEAEKLNAMVGNFSGRLKFSCSLTNDREDGIVSRARYKKELLKSAWEKVISVFDLNKYATSKLKEQINAFVERQTSVPFTMDNIYRMANMIIQTTSQRMETAICDAFDMICSFAPENTDLDKNGRANNVDAWKTNSDYMVNKKFIVPSIFSDFYGSMHNGYNTDRMADVIKALNYICRTEGTQEIVYHIYMSPYEEERLKEEGKPLPTQTVDTGYDFIRFLEKEVVGYGQWHEFGWFRVKLYKKGTMHFEFIGEEGEKIWAIFNQTVAKKRGWEKFHRPFKDGDVIAYDAEKGAQLFIFKEYIYNHDYVQCYMMLDCGGEIDFEIGDYYVERFATEEEKEKLFKAIKDNGYKWNPETKTFEKLVPNKFDISTLKPFDKVLVRDSDELRWAVNLFGFYADTDVYPFKCCGHSNIGFAQCVPYEGNEHLLNKYDECDEYYKNW